MKYLYVNWYLTEDYTDVDSRSTFLIDSLSPWKLGNWNKACQAFGIIGVLVLVGCLVVGILILFMEFDKLPIIAAILAFVAAVCILIEFAVYAGESGADDFGYSFALTIVAFILAIVAGVCFILGKGKA
ncbi:uncharacterized protein [Littorina saxatilis]|uniref:uncharacterized protein n=1 Tax=Littorina saxatilis TaxID=31220 RepID=UPI0038B5E814